MASMALNGSIEYVHITIAAMVVISVLSFVKNEFEHRQRFNTAYHLNSRFTDKVLSCDYDIFTKYGEGYLSTVQNDFSKLTEGLALIFNSAKSVLNLILISITIAIIEVKMIPIIGIVYLVTFIVFPKINKKIREYNKAANDSRVGYSEETEKTVSGFADVRSSCTQDHHQQILDEYNKAVSEYYERKTRCISLTTSSLDLINALFTIVILLYSLLLTTTNNTASIYLSLLYYSWSAMDPIIAIIEKHDKLTEALTSYERYKKFMEIKPTIKNGSIELTSFESSIRFNNVSFRYDTSDKILDGCSLVIHKGEKVGICGSSGGGKSTMLKLISRFYDVTEGSISIDGINIKDLKLNSFRSKIGVVHQSTYVFNGTIRENILYGTVNTSEIELIEACKKAAIYDFIKSLKEGFETNVGQNGLKLSGGQQQRIALARIFLRNPDIIILDEATSALDTESERIIQKALTNFSDDKTIITVAHRLSTIMNSDRIYVINEHKVAEEGTHKELIEKHGIYWRLQNAQME